MKITWNMRFKMFLAALVINVFGIIFAMLLFYHYVAEHFYSEYAASLYERIYIGAKNADLGFQKIYRTTLDISFDMRIAELVNRGDFAQLAVLLKEYREKNILADDIYCYVPAKKFCCDPKNIIRFSHSTKRQLQLGRRLSNAKRECVRFSLKIF